MGTEFLSSGRAVLAGYSGLAGNFVGRNKRLAAALSVDAVAVALALGGLHLTGAMVRGPDVVPNPFVVPSDQHQSVPAAQVTTIEKTVVPLPVPAPISPLQALLSDRSLLFAAPMGAAPLAPIQPAASGSDAGSGFPVAAIPPQGSAGEGQPAANPPEATASNAPPVEKILSIALRGRDRALAITDSTANAVVDAADGSLDRLLVGDVPAAANAVASTGSGVARNVVNTTGSTVSAVTSTAQSTTASATQSVGSTVTQTASTAGQTASAVTQTASNTVTGVASTVNNAVSGVVGLLH